MRAAVGDRLFFILVLSLSLVGIAVFSSAALGLLARENSSVTRDILLQVGLGLGLGFAALFAARAMPLELLQRFSPHLYAASLLMTALVFVPVIGVHANGATRWLDFGPLTFQPAEFLKIGAVFAVAAWLAPRSADLARNRRRIPLFLGILAPALVLLLAQPNTSTVVVILGATVAMYFSAGAPVRDLALLVLAGLIALAAIALVRPYVLQRIETFFNPAAHSLSSGYQIQQSLIAIGSGGFLGRGFGQSVEKFNYLPEPDGDSVFAVFAEETGFLGAVLLIGLFLALFARGLVIAGHSRNLFGGLIAVGFSVILMLQTFVNIGAMTGVIPLTGLPLPFISHGGTAFLAVLVMCGLILNVAARRRA